MHFTYQGAQDTDTLLHGPSCIFRFRTFQILIMDKEEKRKEKKLTIINI